MRTILPVVLLLVAVRPLYAGEPEAVFRDFAYTEVHTVMSDAGTVADTQSKRILVAGDSTRKEYLNGSYDLVDPHTGLSVTVNPLKKTYVIHDRRVVIDTATGKTTESALKQSTIPDHYAMLTHVPEGATHALLKDEISFSRPSGNGRSITQSDEHGTHVTKYWVDAKTNRLNHIEMSWTPKGVQAPVVIIVRKDFDYTPFTDRSIFSLIPPAGYHVTSEPIMALTSSPK